MPRIVRYRILKYGRFNWPCKERCLPQISSARTCVFNAFAPSQTFKCLAKITATPRMRSSSAASHATFFICALSPRRRRRKFRRRQLSGLTCEDVYAGFECSHHSGVRSCDIRRLLMARIAVHMSALKFRVKVSCRLMWVN